MYTPSYFIQCSSVIICILYVVLEKRRGKLSSRGRNLPPPGPKPLPLFGNLFDMPRKREWETITKWGQRYGDVVYVKVLGQNIIFINTAKAAYDLFEKKSAIYSDRPRLPLLRELMKHDWNFGFLPYGNAWRIHRRLFVSKFGPNAERLYNPVQETMANQLLGRLLLKPDDFLDHLRLHAGQLILKYTYGIDISSHHDRYVQVAQNVMGAVSVAGNAGAWFIDAFPILKYIPEWVPGFHFKRLARQWAKDVEELRWVPFVSTKSQLMEGKYKSQPSFVSGCLEEIGSGNADTENMIMDCAALAYGAGSDTSVGTLSVFILAMVHYPEVQKKAQREIDAVVGSSRLPSLKDRDQLPYMKALAKEVLRWHAVAPQGIPHMLREDDIYNGYLIPAGTIVVGNTWGILHDPEVYPEPHVFKPERFFNAEGKLDYSSTDPANYAFGYGRRFCAGSHFAEATLWITAAQILATFDISAIVDGNGRKVIPPINGSSGLLSHPQPFTCVIRPRSQQAIDLIKSNLSQS